MKAIIGHEELYREMLKAAIDRHGVDIKPCAGKHSFRECYAIHFQDTGHDSLLLYYNEGRSGATPGSTHCIMRKLDGQEIKAP